MPVLVKKIYPAEHIQNPKFSKAKQNIFITDPGQPSMADVRGTIWLPEISDAMPNTYTGQVVNVELKYKPYKGQPQFDVVWHNPTAVYTPPAQTMPPQAAQPFQQPAPIATNITTPPQQYTPSQTPSDKDMSIMRQCASKAISEISVPLQTGDHLDTYFEGFFGLCERLVEYYRNGPPNTGAGMNSYEQDHPDDDIPF
jgi:hypothetical protein